MRTFSDSEESLYPITGTRSRTKSSPKIPIPTTSPLSLFRSEFTSDKIAYSYQDEKPRTYSTLSEQLEEELEREEQIRAAQFQSEEEEDGYHHNTPNESESESENKSSTNEDDDGPEWDMELTDEELQQNRIYRLTSYMHFVRHSAVNGLSINDTIEVIRTHHQHLHQGLAEHFQQKASLSP